MSSTKRGLGGGLSNLFGGDVTDLSAAGAAAGGVTQLSLSRIEPNPNQPRKVFDPNALEELAEKSDIVSLHCAVTEETRNLVDAALLRRMKPTAYLINTARGDLVDNEALRQALLEGQIAGAGLDTLSPEPVPAGHPLTALPPEVHRKGVLAPHLGGITEASFRRAHAHMWRNVEHLAAGERPDNIVNGL